MVAAVLHRLDAESSASVGKNLLQSKASVSPPDIATKEVKCEDLKEVVIGDDPEKFFRVGAQLPLQEKEELIEFLKRNIDIFCMGCLRCSRD